MLFERLNLFERIKAVLELKKKGKRMSDRT